MKIINSKISCFVFEILKKKQDKEKISNKIQMETKLTTVLTWEDYFKSLVFYEKFTELCGMIGESQ